MNNNRKTEADNGYPRGNLLARVVGILISPRRTLTAVSREGTSWLPILIVSLALAATRLTMISTLTEEYNRAEFKEWYMDIRKVELEEAERDIGLMIAWAPAVTVLEAPLMIMIGVGFITSLLVIVGRFRFKIVHGFRVVFSVVAWSSLVSAMPLLIVLAIRLLFTNDFNLSLNLGFILTEELVGSYFHNFAQALDLFLIWQIWLISIGFSILYKIRIQRAISYVGTIFILFVIFNALSGGV